MDKSVPIEMLALQQDYVLQLGLIHLGYLGIAVTVIFAFLTLAGFFVIRPFTERFREQDEKFENAMNEVNQRIEKRVDAVLKKFEKRAEELATGVHEANLNIWFGNFVNHLKDRNAHTALSSLEIFITKCAGEASNYPDDPLQIVEEETLVSGFEGLAAIAKVSSKELISKRKENLNLLEKIENLVGMLVREEKHLSKVQEKINEIRTILSKTED